MAEFFKSFGSLIEILWKKATEDSFFVFKTLL